MSEFFVWHSKFGKNPEFGIRLISKGEGEIMNILVKEREGYCGAWFAWSHSFMTSNFYVF